MPGGVSFREADDIAAGETYPCGCESLCDACSGFPLGRDLPPFDFLDCARVNLGQPGKVFLSPVEASTGGANLGGGKNGRLRSSGGLSETYHNPRTIWGPFWGPNFTEIRNIN